MGIWPRPGGIRLDIWPYLGCGTYPYSYNGNTLIKDNPKPSLLTKFLNKLVFMLLWQVAALALSEFALRLFEPRGVMHLSERYWGSQ